MSGRAVRSLTVVITSLLLMATMQGLAVADPQTDPYPGCEGDVDPESDASNPDRRHASNPDRRHTNNPDRRHTSNPDRRHTNNPDRRHNAKFEHEHEPERRT